MGLKHTFSFSITLVSLSHPGIQTETEISSLCVSFALPELKQFLFCLPTHSALEIIVTVVVMGFATVSIFR